MTEPAVLWRPRADALSSTRLGRFLTFCEHHSGGTFVDYDALWAWSVGDGLEDFWACVWAFFDVDGSVPYDDVVSGRTMPGARWFGGARLNYAQHALRHADGHGDEVAIVAISQSRERVELTWRDLHSEVARVRSGLADLGVRPGDRVAAWLPNVAEAVIAFLAAASLGATWTSCAPEFGVPAVLDRFGQVEPRVLIAVDGYRYGSRVMRRVDELAAIRAGLPSLRHTVMVPGVDGAHLAETPDAIDWTSLGAVDPAPMEFAQVPADHPLYVLYSSGTTGMPKAIVHGHGGILVEHLKALALHGDMGPGDRFFWFTTTGWMMWNYLVSGLTVGAGLVLFDGDPAADGADTLWRLAAEEQVTWFGVGSPSITAARKAGIVPGETCDLSALRAVGATGAPLPPEDFDWITHAVSPTAMISPISGGTDVCSAFVGGSPLTPVWRGEIPCRYLGAAVDAFDPDGAPLVDTQGELVVTEPMPSMPVGFVGDDDGSRLRAAYFDDYPGTWRHGDWITITSRGSCVISGRSDATLNRGGVRVGTAELYRVVEATDEVADSLVVHLEGSDADDPGALVLFVVAAPSVAFGPDQAAAIRARVRRDVSPRHVPDEICVIDSVPTTLSGKKLELPVKKILQGALPDDVASRDSLRDPASLDAIVAFASTYRGEAL